MTNPYSYEVVIHDKVNDDVTYYFDTDSGAETFKRSMIRQGRVTKINKINNFDVGYSVMTEEKKPIFIYESPDKGKTVYSREFGSNPMNRKLIMKNGVETNERKT